MNKKESYLFCKFLKIETKKIEIEKWIEGIHINKDPGDLFVLEWINNNAKMFRDLWNASKCQHCSRWMECGFNVKPDCVNFNFDEVEDDLNEE